MKLTSYRLAGKRAIAAIAATALITTGVAAVDPSMGFAQEQTPTASVTGSDPRAGSTENVSFANNQVEAGGALEVTLTDVPRRPSTDGLIGIRLNDGEIPLGAQPTGEGNPEDADGRGDVYYNVTSGGDHTFTVDIPADLAPGWYWLRFLGGADGGDAFSWYNWFQVVDPNAPTEETTTPAASGPAVAISGATSQADTSVRVSVSVTGFEPGETITASVGGTESAFAAGRGTAAEATADENGAYTGTVVVPAGTLVTGVEHTLTLTGSEGSTAENLFKIPASISLDNTSANGTLNASVGNLPDGAVVEKIGTAANNWLSEPLTAADGVASVEGLTISDEPGEAIIALVTIGDKTFTVNSGSSVTGDASAVNADQFDTQRLDLASGLYQSAYSAKNDALFVTRAVGRPPIRESTLYKVDPNTMEVVAEITPDAVEGTEGLYAVYGVGVDDVNNAVWVTNTRQNTVAVYSQDDLSLIQQFPIDSTGHSRDVVVDHTTGLAYVSSPRNAGGNIDVYDINEGKVDTISLGDEFGSTMSLDLDQETGELFTVSLENPLAAKIELHNNNAATIFEAPGLSTGSGVAFVPENRELWVVGQSNGDAIVINVDTGEVVDTVTVGAGALNAEYEPVSNTVFVVHRTDGTVAVIGASSRKLLGQLADEPGGLTNHLEADGKGNIFSVNKASEGEDGATTNRLVRITPKFKDEVAADDDNSGDDNTGATDDNTGATDDNAGAGDDNTGATDDNTGATDDNTGTTDGESTNVAANGFRVNVNVNSSLRVVFNEIPLLTFAATSAFSFSIVALNVISNWLANTFIPALRGLLGQ